MSYPTSSNPIQIENLLILSFKALIPGSGHPQMPINCKHYQKVWITDITMRILMKQHRISYDRRGIWKGSWGDIWSHLVRDSYKGWWPNVLFQSPNQLHLTCVYP